LAMNQNKNVNYYYAPVDNVEVATELLPVAEEHYVIPQREQNCKQSRLRRLLRFLGIMVAIFCIMYLLVATVGSGYFYYQVQKCLNPDYVLEKKLSFSPSNVSSIDLGVVSGKIVINSCPKADKIYVTVHHTSRTHEGLSKMASLVVEKNGLLSIHSMGPSFGCRHCQLSHIHITLPRSLTGISNLSLKAHVHFGAIDVQEVTLSSAQFVASVGVINVENLKAETLNVFNTIGSINLEHVRAQVCECFLRVGILGTHFVSSVRNTLAVAYGYIHAGEVVSSTFEVAAAFGKITIHSSYAKKISADIDYGVINFRPSDAFEGKFMLDSVVGGVYINRIEAQRPQDCCVFGALKNKKSTRISPETARTSSIELSSFFGFVEMYTPADLSVVIERTQPRGDKNETSAKSKIDIPLEKAKVLPA